MARCRATLRGIPGLDAAALNIPVVSASAIFDATGHWEARTARAPAKKNALTRPLKPVALGVPSPAAVLQAERTTKSAAIQRREISDMRSKPSFLESGVLPGV